MNLALILIPFLVLACFIAWVLDSLQYARVNRNLNKRDITIRLEMSELEGKLRSEIHEYCGVPQRRKTDKNGSEQQ